MLDLSYNKIDGLEDLIELGTMQHLNIIDFSNNPLCIYLTRINILEELLCPKKYAKYDAVKILTAGYIKIPTGTSKFQ